MNENRTQATVVKPVASSPATPGATAKPENTPALQHGTSQPNRSTGMRVRVDHLQVAGLAPKDRGRFVRALERELRDVARNAETSFSSPQDEVHIPHVSAGRLRANATPEQAAAQVARQLARQMQPRTETQVRREEANHA